MSKLVKILDQNYARQYNIVGRVVKILKTEVDFYGTTYDVEINHEIYCLRKSEVEDYQPKMPEYLK